MVGGSINPLYVSAHPLLPLPIFVSDQFKFVISTVPFHPFFEKSDFLPVCHDKPKHFTKLPISRNIEF